MIYTWVFNFIILTFFILEVRCGNGFANECIARKFNYSSFVCVCNSTYCDFPPKIKRTPVGKYQLYTSSEARHRFKRTCGSFQNNCHNTKNGTDFVINKRQKYQNIIGFGGAFTDSAGINIVSLSREAQNNLLRAYFSPEGIKYNLGRVPIGGSDFSTREYTYDDHNFDVSLSLFSLQKEDKDYKIPLMKKAQKMSGDEMRFFGAAWKAPDWMKTNFNTTESTGFIKKEFFQTWAKYHLLFLEDYKKAGVDFWAISTGNEPFAALFTGGFIQVWTPQDQFQWIVDNLGPTLRHSSFKKVLILGLDDQRNFLPFWNLLLGLNASAIHYIDGIAVHFYTDTYAPASILDDTHATYPNKFILYTEAAFGSGFSSENAVWLGSWERAEAYASDIIEDLQHWTTGWVDWNLALNLQGGPNWINNFCDAAIIVNAKKDEFYKQPMFYALGHFSRFLQRDGHKISISPEVADDILAVAVLNPDDSVAVVFLNKRPTNAKITVTDLDLGCITLKLPKKSISTLVYWV